MKAIALIVVSIAACAAPLGAQRDSIVPVVRGVVFDSIGNRPLTGAFVAVVGASRNATSDARGRFHLDSVPAGVQTLVVQHPVLDTLGFSGIRLRVRVNERDEIRLATPSFPTLWKQTCGDQQAPRDGGLVYGVVRDAGSNRPIGNALVSVVWNDSVRSSAREAPNLADKDAEAFARAREKQPRRNDPVRPFDIAMSSRSGPDPRPRASVKRLRSASDSSGVYVLCGLPVGAFEPRMSAMVDSTLSDTVLLRQGVRVQRLDLRIPVTTAGNGTIMGRLTDRAGVPVPHARIRTSDFGESRSDDSGRFVLREIPPGTRTLEVRFIGMTPVRSTVEVTAGDTVSTTIVLDRVPTLGAINVRSTGLGRVLAAEFNDRRRIGLGHVVDSTVISRFNTMEVVLRGIPGLTVRRKGIDVTFTSSDGHGSFCEPTVYMDGLEANPGHLVDLSTTEAQAIEAYLQPLTVPAQFVQKGVGRKCGVILVWTSYAFRNR